MGGEPHRRAVPSVVATEAISSRHGHTNRSSCDCRRHLINGLAARDGLGAADVRLAGLLRTCGRLTQQGRIAVGAVLGLLYGGFTGAVMLALRRASVIAVMVLTSGDEPLMRAEGLIN